MKMKKSESLDKISGLIDSGIKIARIEPEKQEIQFIECVIFESGKTKPFYKPVHVPEKDHFNKLQKTKKFRNALFNPQDRGILLMDVAGYSRHDTLYQASILSIFNQAVRHALQKFQRLSGRKCLEQVVPTGDGCFLIFDPCVNEYFLKAAYVVFSEMNLAQDRLIGKYAEKPNACEKMYLRFSCTMGETDFFIDPTGKRNCYGTGMNEAERLLTLGQIAVRNRGINKETFDSFFIDRSLFSQANGLITLLKNKNHHPQLTDLGSVPDKHGIQREIFWLLDLPPFEEIEL